jgi:hypothetical protein
MTAADADSKLTGREAARDLRDRWFKADPFWSFHSFDGGAAAEMFTPVASSAIELGFFVFLEGAIVVGR